MSNNSHDQVLLEVFGGRSRMESLGLKNFLDLTGITNFQRRTAARNRLEVFRKPDQVLKFGNLWSRSSDFSGGFIFSGRCDTANRFQVLPYSFMVKEYSSPYNDLVTLTDGTFLKLCRPGRLGNQIWQMDQPEGQLYHELT
jgi:hypothetical protein